jgi:hypothetical protein
MMTKTPAERATDTPLPFCTPEYCNVAAQALGVDPAGHGRAFDDVVLLETPLPWKRTMYDQAGVLPQELLDLSALWLARYRAEQPYNHGALMIAPDPQYSQPGYRRVIYFARRSGVIACFDRTEYLVPEAQAGALIWALFEAQEALPTFEPYRQAIDATLRDLLICTHGTVDVACAKFGYPLYRLLRDCYAGNQMRVWRVSHFGGHVFAPTLLEMPTGHFWAYVGEEQAHQIATRSGDVAALAGHYRGWAGVPSGFMQAAECQAWQEIGWSWFDHARCAAIIAQGPDGIEAQWATVRIDYVRPDRTSGTMTHHVKITQQIETRHSTRSEQAHNYAQYRVCEPAFEPVTQ